MTHHAFSQANMGLYSLRAREKSMDTLLSVEEAARKLGGISKWTVHAWLAEGKLRRTKVGSRTMIRESELQKVIHDEGEDSSRG
jgi:excisionase family DNA binding protein